MSQRLLLIVVAALAIHALMILWLGPIAGAPVLLIGVALNLLFVVQKIVRVRRFTTWGLAEFESTATERQLQVVGWSLMIGGLVVLLALSPVVRAG